MQMFYLVVSQSALIEEQIAKKFFSKVAESWAICFGSKTPKTVCFTLKTQFYLQFDLISEISTPENARIDILIISLGYGKVKTKKTTDM